MTRFFLFSVSLIFLQCASEYKMLTEAPFEKNCLDHLQPMPIHTQWFDAGIDVVGKHVSGLMLIKSLPDSSQRVVFTNEAGVTFLDFGWKGTTFRVHHVINQLNRKAVINLLRKDFELILGIPFRNAEWKAWKDGNEVFIATAYNNQRIFLVGPADCSNLNRVEIGSARKKLVTLRYENDTTMTLKHHTFEMDIRLTKLEKQ